MTDLAKQRCPICRATHYEVGGGCTTAAYYPTIFKDGININPDRNTTTYGLRCMECGHCWQVKITPGDPQ